MFTAVIEFIFMATLVLRSSMDYFKRVTFGPLDFNAASLAGTIVIACTLLYWYFRRKIEVPILARIFAGWLIINAVFVGVALLHFGSAGFIAVKEWIRLVSIFAVFLFSYNCIRTAKDNFLNVLFLALPIPLIVTIHQIFTGGGRVIQTIPRVFGTFVHPNHLAAFLVLFFALTWYMLIVSKRKVLLAILLFTEAFALVFTVTFGGYIVFLIIASLLFASRLAPRRLKILLCCAVAVFIITFLWTPQCRRKASLFKPGVAAATLQKATPVVIIETFGVPVPSDAPKDSFSWRLENWGRLYKVWEKRPFIGWGLQMSAAVNPYISSKTQKGYAPHNDYLKFLVETGLVGLLGYLLFALSCALIFWSEFRRSKDRQIKILLYVIVSVFIAFQIGALADNYSNFTAVQWYFWAAAAAALRWNALSMKDKR